MKLKNIIEKVDSIPTTPQRLYVDLYYGGCLGAAKQLESTGFNPSTIGVKSIPLFSTPEMAKTYAGFRDCDAIVEVKNVPIEYLQIDYKDKNSPEDMYDALNKINSGENIKLLLVKKLQASNFKFINKLRKSVNK